MHSRNLSRLWLTVLAGVTLVTSSVFVSACGSGNSGNASSATANATVSLSDPATCAGPSGPFAHVYVTITDVQANTSATAGDADAGWNDLTPKLSSAPKQIDLLGEANNQCFLATLGDNAELQPGNYQQIRLVLAPNTAKVTNDQCGGSANCVVLEADNSIHPLELSSEAKTGLKIPSGQIASGGFNIAAGQTKDLNIDFNTCASIVLEGNGKYRLKPVLHAGEVSTTSTSINGKVLDSVTGNPVNGVVSVALEQKDSTGVDRIVMSTLTAADGTFVFCPIPAGTYDLVIVATGANGAAYAPTVVTGVANGETVGNVKLYGATVAATSQVTLSGLVSSQNASSQGTSADVALSALETVGGNVYTVPLLPSAQQPSATLAVSTSADASCPTGTDCASYSMVLPSAGAYVGAYSTSGSTLTQSGSLASYIMDGLAFVPGSGGTVDCSPSEIKSSGYAVATGGVTVAAQPLAFTSCQ